MENILQKYLGSRKELGINHSYFFLGWKYCQRPLESSASGILIMRVLRLACICRKHFSVISGRATGTLLLCFKEVNTTSKKLIRESFRCWLGVSITLHFKWFLFLLTVFFNLIKSHVSCEQWVVGLFVKILLKHYMFSYMVQNRRYSIIREVKRLQN